MGSEIVVIGMGPGPLSLLTRQAEEELLAADKVLFRMSGHPVYHWLEEQGKDLLCFDSLYTIPRITNEQLYGLIAQAVVTEAKLRGRAVYALPGNPFVMEESARLVEREARAEGVAFRVVPGMSFLELIYTELAVDPARGLQILIPGDLRPSAGRYSAHLGLIVGLIGKTGGPDPERMETNHELVSRWLLEKYPPGHPVSLVWSDGLPDYETRTKTFSLGDLVGELEVPRFVASLYVPPLESCRMEE